jgi:hypothetical protein
MTTSQLSTELKETQAPATSAKPNNYYQTLTDKLSFISSRAFATNNVFQNHPKLKQLCPDYIYAGYCVASATVPLMEETVRCAKLLPDDPICKPLIKYLEQHIEEERGHDQWYIRDLAHLGLSREEVTSRIQPGNSTAMIGSQYYWVRHQHPIAFMGYLASIETYPPTVEYVEKLIKDSGLPAEGFETLMMHAKIDIAHKEDIINLLNTLPLTKAHKAMIEMSAFQTFRYIALTMEEICKKADYT